MLFKRLQIHYQTARSLPAPYAYFYTLTAHPIANNALQIDLTITYPDRDDIDDDELIAEGFTRDDDFIWAGRLPNTWLESVMKLLTRTQLQPLDEDALDEDDDFWNMTLDDAGGSQQGSPANADDWQYLVQELIQAAYESIGRERPFELTYLDLNGQQDDLEMRLTASFAERTVDLVTIRNRRERPQKLPWAILQKIMSKVYEHNFDSEDSQLKRPRQAGQWLNLGSEEWYDVRPLRALTNALKAL